MPCNAQETKTVRKSFIVTFANHAPIRLWGEFDAENGERLGDYEAGCVWDCNPQWGHNDVCYYVTKGGKRLYWGSYNSGESYGGRDPKTIRTFLKTIADVKDYIVEHSDESEWHRVCHRVDPALIVDSELL